MKITNRLGLSESWVIAAQDNYVKVGDYSVTQLIHPVQQSFLKERHDDEIVIDIADRTDIIFGKAMHKIGELYAPESAISEEGVSITILGKQVGGRPDFINPLVGGGNVLRDYKSTSVWQWVKYKGQANPEWILQGNTYRYILKLNDIDIREIVYEAYFKDWSKKDAMMNPKDYPQEKVAKYILPIKSDGEVREFLEERVELFEMNKRYPDHLLQNCTEDERWVREKGFAVVFTKGKSKGNAVPKGKHFNTRSEADRFFSQRKSKTGKDDAKVVYRCGESPRCKYYCDVKDFCHQYKNMNNEEPF